MPKANTDGFMVLIPKAPKLAVQPNLLKESTHDKGIGAQQFVLKSKAEINAMSAANDARPRFRYQGSKAVLEYETGYKPKTWQNRAWAIIGKGINWTIKPAFRGYKKISRRLQHLLRIGVSLKVQASIPCANTSDKAKPTIMQLPKKTKGFTQYMIGNTSDEITKIFEDVYDLMYNHVDEIVGIIDNLEYEEAVFLIKVFVVYDDKSYDFFSGDPRKLFEHFDVSFDKKGKVKL